MTIRVMSKLAGIPVEIMEIKINANPNICNSINIDEVSRRITSNYPSPRDITGDPRVREYRRTLWSFKIDPTKTRPSPEALLRRLVRGKGFPLVNCAVDMVNLASMEYIVCIGLYDRRKLPSKHIILKTSSGSQTFYLLGGNERILPVGVPIVVSGDIVIHQYPSRDSRLTSVDYSSEYLVAIAYGHLGDDPEYLKESLNRFKELIDMCGCLKEL